MTLDMIYFLVLVPAIALIAGVAAIVSTERSAKRIRAAEAEQVRKAS